MTQIWQCWAGCLWREALGFSKVGEIKRAEFAGPTVPVVPLSRHWGG